MLYCGLAFSLPYILLNLVVQAIHLYSNYNEMPNYSLQDRSQYQRGVMGQNGFKYLTSGGTSSTPSNDDAYLAIQALEEATITTTNVETGEGDALSGVTIPAGAIIVGYFSSVSVSSGRILAYRA